MQGTSNDDTPRSRELSLPFVRLLSSRAGHEVSSALASMIEEVEALSSEVIPPSQSGTRRVAHVHLFMDSKGGEKEACEQLEVVVDGLKFPTDDSHVLRVHSDRAKELVGRKVFAMLKERGIRQTSTSTHSFKSNGRAENGIKLMKSMIRRALLASGLPVFFWGYAALHTVQSLRAHALRNVGERRKDPLPFGTYVCVRRLKYAREFAPFENRGVCGRLLLENITGDRLCWILTESGMSSKGVVAARVYPGPTMTPETRTDLEDLWTELGWKYVHIEGNHSAWYHPEKGAMVLAPPVMLDEVELAQDGQELTEHESLSACTKEEMKENIRTHVQVFAGIANTGGETESDSHMQVCSVSACSLDELRCPAAVQET
eukprot:2328025-Amphidinium_carterae.1